MFNPFGSMFGKKREHIVRQDESHEDIMKRMNAIGDEMIDTKKNHEYKDVRGERFLQVMGVGGLFLLLILISFVMSCRNSGKKKNDDDSDEDCGVSSKQKLKKQVKN